MSEAIDVPENMMRTSDDSFYRNVIEQVRDIVLIVDASARIISANLAAEQAYGCSASELKSMHIYDLRAPETRSEVAAQLRQARQEGILFRTLHQRKSGEIFPVEVSSRHLNSPGQSLVVSIIRDITENVAMETALHKKNEELLAAHEELLASDEEIRQQFDELMTKDAKLERQNVVLALVNQMAMGLMRRRDLGEVLKAVVTGATSLIGTSHGFVSLVDEAAQVFVRKVSIGFFERDGVDKAPLTEGLLGQAYRTGEMAIVEDYRLWEGRIKLASYAQFHCSVAIPLKIGEKNIGALVLAFQEMARTLADDEIFLLKRVAELASLAIDEAALAESYRNELQERRRAEAVIRKMAYRDALTGLPNRAYLKEFLTAELEKAKTGAASGAVLYVDLDDLKIINDNFGHSYGDEVIGQIGGCLVAEAGPQASVARIGGDEFIVVLPHMKERSRIKAMTDHLVGQLCKDYDIGLCSSHLSASIGVCLYPQDGNTVEEVLKNADLALYEAKKKGKNTWRFYDMNLQRAAYESMSLKQGLREAIKRGELALVYQPLVDSGTGEVVSFEALLRWTPAAFGPVPPSKFIPLAEESGVIKTIGEWVIREACGFASTLKELEYGDIRVAVNVSPRQLIAAGFAHFVLDEIAKADISPRQLEIEITESALMTSVEESILKLTFLRSTGMGLSLDDFGSGYSSLAYLRNLPVTTVKIDKSFIDDIETDAAQLKFVQSIVHMAHGQKLRVAAEGVESRSQFETLKACQCDYIQGFFFSRPVPASEAIQFLKRSRDGQAGDEIAE